MSPPFIYQLFLLQNKTLMSIYVPRHLLNLSSHIWNDARSKKNSRIFFKNDELNDFLISRKVIYTILIAIYINHIKSKIIAIIPLRFLVFSFDFCERNS